MNALLQDAINRLNQTLNAETVLFKINYKTGGVEQRGNILRAFCPIHREEMIRSLIIDTSRSTFRCLYTSCRGHRGGRFFELYKLSRNVDDLTAVKELAAEVGMKLDLEAIEHGPKAGKTSAMPEEPVPAVAPEIEDSDAPEPEPEIPLDEVLYALPEEPTESELPAVMPSFADSEDDATLLRLDRELREVQARQGEMMNAIVDLQTRLSRLAARLDDWTERLDHLFRSLAEEDSAEAGPSGEHEDEAPTGRKIAYL